MSGVKDDTLQAKGAGSMSKNLEISTLLDYYGMLLTDKQRETVEYYYDDDLSLGEIAENTGISRQGVRDSIKRSETILLEAEEKLGLIKKSEMLKKSLEEIRKDIDIIDEKNMKIYRSDIVNESIKKILKELNRIDEMI